MPALRAACLATALLFSALAPVRADVALSSLPENYFVGAWSVEGPNKCDDMVSVFHINGAVAGISAQGDKVHDIGTWHIEGDAVIVSVGRLHALTETKTVALTVQAFDQNRIDMTATLPDGTTSQGTMYRCL